ncbi:hypothetical protein N7510_006533 [Penicillium lagena]|uniref:uncharacterized protein n=1 Tax=Penicillium lagena TaxID=94218 RepID=UPI00254245CE|nr:uncharacterized protein N7510_006533 [Penicillium lagena]KAJ5613339.1 hypothetical protein N7510_006533 [Penicillium lagena]
MCQHEESRSGSSGARVGSILKLLAVGFLILSGTYNADIYYQDSGSTTVSDAAQPSGKRRRNENRKYLLSTRSGNARVGQKEATFLDQGLVV